MIDGRLFEDNKVDHPRELVKLVTRNAHSKVVFIGKLQSANELSTALRTNTRLQTLVLASSRLGALSGGLRGLCAALSDHPGLTELNLRSNALGAKGAKIIAQTLLKSETLQRLSLRSNYLKDAGALYIIEAIASNVVVVRLDLTMNAISAKTGEALAGMLLQNSVLQELFLHGNDLGDAGIVAIADALKSNSSLRTLVVSQNAFGKTGANALESACEVSNSLQTLDFGYSGLSTFTQLKERERRNKQLTSLSYNQISARQALKINTMLEDKVRKRFAKVTELFQGDKLNEKASWRRSKLMVVGDGCAGKTATVRSLLNQKFVSEWRSTVGAELQEISTTNAGLWRTEKDRGYAIDLASRLATTPLTTKQRFNEVAQAREVQQQQLQDEVEAARVAVEEVNMPGVAVPEAMAVQLPEYMYVTNTYDEHTVRMSIWDYGGQAVFYSLHQLLLTRYGVYIIVFDLTKTEIEVLEFWLHSIRLHAPNAPVFIVATFLDKFTKPRRVTKALEDIEVELLALNEQVFKSVLRAPNNLVWPISNKQYTGVKELRNAIETITREQEFVHEQVSVRWMRALDELKGVSWISLSDFKLQLTQDGWALASEELNLMLSLFHEFGTLLYFSATEHLREFIVVDPQWIIDKISKVIRDPTLHLMDPSQFQTTGLAPDLEELLTSGIASQDLLVYLWGVEHAGYLLDLMRHLLLVSNWHFDKADVPKLLIPSMAMRRKFNNQHDYPLTIFFDFPYLPNGVFERVVCICVDFSALESSSREPELFENRCFVWLGENAKVEILKLSKSTLKVSFDNRQQANQLLEAFTAMMTKIKHEVFGETFTWAVRLKDREKSIGFAKAKEIGLNPWFDTSGRTDVELNINEFILNA